MNAVDAQAQPGGILPAAAAALPVGSLLEITYRDGNTVEGIIKDTQGATWAECSDGATILLYTPWGPPGTAAGPGPPSTTTRGPRCKAASMPLCKSWQRSASPRRSESRWSGLRARAGGNSHAGNTSRPSAPPRLSRPHPRPPARPPAPSRRSKARPPPRARCRCFCSKPARLA